MRSRKRPPSDKCASSRPSAAAPAPSQPQARRWVLVVLAAILLLAVVLRGLYLAELVHSPTFGDTGVDGVYHNYWARALATGDWTPPPDYDDPLIRTTPCFRPPGYAYFLALIYRAMGPSCLAAVVVQMVLGVASCLLGFFFAKRWFGDAVALLFAASLGTYWIFIYYEGELLEPVLLVPLSLLLLYALSLWTEGMTFRRGLLAGLALGLFALARPNVLVCGVAVVLWAFWVSRRSGSRTGWLRSTAGLGIATALVIAPVTLRNYAAAREFVPISTNGGVNFWIGNNPLATGMYVAAPGLEGFDTCFGNPRLVRNLERKLGRPLRDSEASAYFTQQAWDYIKANPLRTLGLLGRKALLFWGPGEVHTNTVQVMERQNSPVLRSTVLNFPIALALFLVGTAMFFADARRSSRQGPAKATSSRRQIEVVVLILLFAATYCLSFLPFFVAAQYRVPLIPSLLLMAAYAVVHLFGLARAAEWKRLAAWVPICGIAGGLASVNFAGYEPNIAKWYYDRGTSYFRQGKVDDAIREYSEATRLLADYPDAYVALGAALARNGRLPEAVEAYRAAIRLKPDNAKAYLSLGLALEGQRKREEAKQAYQAASRYAPDYADVFINRGIALQARGQLDEAMQAYGKAIRLAPDSGSAYSHFASILYAQGRYAEAWITVRQARRCGKEPPASFIKSLSERMPEPRQ